MKNKLILTSLFLLFSIAAGAKEYDIVTTGLPIRAVVKISGHIYHGCDYPGGMEEINTTFEAETISYDDITITAGEGYVYHVSIDNANAQVIINFRHDFNPTPTVEAGLQYEYLVYSQGGYLSIDGTGVHYSPKKGDADRIAFVEDPDNVGCYYIYDLTAKCYLTGIPLTATERDVNTGNLSERPRNWKFIMTDDRKSLSVVPGSVKSPTCPISAGEWVIKPYSTGNLACAKTMFSLPGKEYMHKIVPEEGVTVLDVDFGSLTTLKFCEDRTSTGNRYKYVKGMAPEEEGVYHYSVKVKDATGSVESIPVTLTVSSFLQSPTPGMGWLTWNWFEREISHKKLLNIVKGMKKHNLIDAGYHIILIDDAWATNQTDQALLTYDPAKFTKGVSGLVKAFKKVDPRMQVGLYSDAGLMTCANYQPGSFGFEEPHIALFDLWGVDMLKYDFCDSQASAYDSYGAMGAVITRLNERRQKEGKVPFIFNLCEWGMFYPWMWGPEIGGCSWRASGDAREIWIGHHGRTGVLGSVDEVRNMWMWTGVNRFNDLDMTVMGLHGLGCPSNNTGEHMSNGGVIPGINAEQARSQMALWCMLSSPVFLTCDLRTHPKAEANPDAGVLPSPLVTEEDVATMTNKYLISINQDVMGQQAEYMEHLSTGAIEYVSTGYDVYVKDLSGERIAVAVLNRSGDPLGSVNLPLKELYLQDSAEYNCLDIWTGTTSGISGVLSTGVIKPYQTKVYIISSGIH